MADFLAEHNKSGKAVNLVSGLERFVGFFRPVYSFQTIFPPTIVAVAFPFNCQP